jgi:hypothetical protein
MPQLSTRPGRLAVPLAIALLAALALAIGAPRAAEAAPSCAKGDFCLWEHISYTGGRYNWRSDDMNLANDRFVGGSGSIVAGKSSSAYNNGYTGGYDKVRMYGPSGAIYGACVTPGSTAWNNLRWAPYHSGYYQNINDYVTGFRWVTTC